MSEFEDALSDFFDKIKDDPSVSEVVRDAAQAVHDVIHPEEEQPESPVPAPDPAGTGNPSDQTVAPQPEDAVPPPQPE
jgi:hypothetical protein